MEDEERIEEGINLYNRGNYSSAISYFLSLPEDSSVDIFDLSYYLGLCYFRLERYEDSLIYLEQIVTSYEREDDEAEPDRVLQCRYILAIIYFLSGRKRLSEFELEKLAQSTYRVSSVYASLAYLAWDRGDFDLSVEYYEKALENDSENITALNGLGYVLACKGEELTKALSCCKKALDAAPKSFACMDSLAWVYYKLGLYSEAESWLRKALSRISSMRANDVVDPLEDDETSIAYEVNRKTYDMISAHLDTVLQTENL